MQVLITGSKGLIGAALKKALQELQVKVSGIDNNYSLDHPEYGDILNQNALFPLIEQADGIVHLAAISRVMEGERNPQLCWKTNVEGTRNVIEAALASEKKPWVLFASSREVYGRQTDFPVKETAPLRPLNTYGESKREGEQLVQEAQRRGLKTAILRFSNVFGNIHDYQDRVIPAFCRAAVLGEEMRIAGKDHLFDFTHLEDVIQGILSLILLLMKDKTSFPTIHLARGIAISLGYIAEIAQKESDHSLKIVEDFSYPFQVSKFWGDTDLAHEILNWKTSISVEEGMHRLIQQYEIFFESQKLVLALNG
jgi:UDP-glucose 4-epimerase